MTKFIIEQLRKENAFLNDMLENAHNRSRLLEEQLQQAQTELSRYKQGVEVETQVRSVSYRDSGIPIKSYIESPKLNQFIGQYVSVLVRARDEV